MRKLGKLSVAFLGSIVLGAAGCGGEIGVVDGQSSTRIEEGLSGCVGQASSAVPGDGHYFLTTFGYSAGDDGQMSCGDYTKHGSWYYAASRQRYGCGSHIKIEANGKCVVVQTDDYGPDSCVERAAGGPIIDASPLVSQHLFGATSVGWSDHFRIRVTVVSKSTPLGPCTGGGNPPPPPPPPPAACHSSTLDKNVANGTCVQSSSDQNWYECEGGSWKAGRPSCSQSYAWCHSNTLGKNVAPRTCVQSRSDNRWYQCGATGWESPVASGRGPLGNCSIEYGL